MTWFWIALAAPALYAFANHTDKYLISKYFKNSGVGALIIFSAIFSVFVLPIFYILNPDVLSIGLPSALVLTVNGSLTVISIVLYFHALQRDEASVVVPFYQTIPIFGFILGYLILGETLNTPQIIGSLLIILGAFILALKLEEGAIRFRWAVVLLMLGASLLYAINGVIFKLLALDGGFLISAFWTFAGKVVLGVLFLLFISSYRRQFIEVLKQNSVRVLGLNSLNEIATITADTATFYASLLAPVALVLTVNGFQPFFVLLYGVLLTMIFPQIVTESLRKADLVQKTLAIGLIIAGALFLSY